MSLGTVNCALPSDFVLGILPEEPACGAASEFSLRGSESIALGNAPRVNSIDTALVPWSWAPSCAALNPSRPYKSYLSVISMFIRIEQILKIPSACRLMVSLLSPFPRL